MLPDRWYPVLESSQLGRRAVGLRRLGRDLVLWRGADGRAVVAPVHCPHRGASLAGARVERGELVCPWHGFRFDGAGRCTAIPCEGAGARPPQAMSLATHPVRESRGLVWLWNGDAHGALPELPTFAELDADTRNAYETSYVLPYHYSRMVETNLDLHHTPFVHKSVFKPYTRVDDFEATIDGERIRTRGVLRRERAGGREFPFRVDTILPCMGLVELTPKLRIVVSATPIDDDHTWMWFRYYQNYTDVPLLRKFVAWISVKSELWWVQPQDWRIFQGMTPGTIDDAPHCYVQADKGIGLYRRRRTEILAHGTRQGAS